MQISENFAPLKKITVDFKLVAETFVGLKILEWYFFLFFQRPRPNYWYSTSFLCFSAHLHIKAYYGPALSVLPSRVPMFLYFNCKSIYTKFGRTVSYDPDNLQKISSPHIDRIWPSSSWDGSTNELCQRTCLYGICIPVALDRPRKHCSFTAIQTAWLYGLHLSYGAWSFLRFS